MRAVLDTGALPQLKTIEYGVQIAHGLAAAHEKSIVHRDLKPENVFVTRDGRIKILDFGLAKLAQKAGADSDELTLTSSHTVAGVVLGTASYMAPEQVRGEAVDARTDIFAFGAVLYEMLSGVRAFRRDTAAETMTAVLKDDPPELSNSARSVSPTLERIVRRCLEKSADQRFQSARDLSFALSALSGTETSGVARAAAAADESGESIYLKAATGLERERKGFTIPRASMYDIVPNSWSLDDRQILCTRQMASGNHLELLPAAGGEPIRFLTARTAKLTDRFLRMENGWRMPPMNPARGGLCYFLSCCGGNMAGIARRWHRATLARRRQGNFLHRTQRHTHSGSGERRKHIRDRHTHTVISDPRPRPDFEHRRLHLRRL